MIKKNLKEHSMGICDIESHRTTINATIPWLHSRLLNPRPQRWFLKINDFYFYIKLESESLAHNGFLGGVRKTPTSPTMCLNPNQLEIKLIDTISDVNSAEFLRDWMASDSKIDTTLERLNPVGEILEKWQLYGSFIQEMHHEIVYDRTIGDITIRLNYDYANLIF